MYISNEAHGAVRTWMFQAALPLWADKGIDKTFGGPVEALTGDGREVADIPFKRTRVAGRQLYVFSHAALLGWSEGRSVADHLFEHLTTRAWGGADIGWRRLIALDGAPLDSTPDLYDYAFALFGLGWYHKLTGDSRALDLAHRTLDILDRLFRHPQGGFLHEFPATPPRQQNPHMHLIEAALVLAETSGDGRFRALANEVHDLFLRRIVRLPEGILPEFFEDDWRPVANQIIEPGHQMEWAWILGRHQALTGHDNTSAMKSLMAFSETHGFDPSTGWTRNQIGVDGRILNGGSRSWPNTERIKGWLALEEFTGVDASAPVQRSLDALFAWHLKHDVPGCWQDAFDADGRPLTSTVPASTLYHVFLAFTEVLRLAAPPASDAGR